MSDNATSFRWYVVNARSGFEKSVATALRERMTQANLVHKFGEILVPAEEIVELHNGQKRRSERKFFPGYVLVQIESHEDMGIPLIDNECWHLVRETNKVQGFIGGTTARPLPITEAEANLILKRVEKGAEKPTPKTMFSIGDEVRIKEGPFNDFNGVVERVDPDRGKVAVSVLIFGRPTPVELEFGQVERTR